MAREQRSNAREDYLWFYADSGRVTQYQGMVVAVSNRRVVGSGTAAEAVAGAKLRGVDSPLLIRVLSDKERAANQMGL